MAAPLLPPAPQTPLKSTRTRSRLRSNTFSLSSPPSYSGRSFFGSSPASVKTHHRGGSSALLIPDGTSAPAPTATIKTKAASPSSARGHASRPSIGTPFAPAPRQLNAPRYAPPIPPLMPVPLCTPPLPSPLARSTVFEYPFPEQEPPKVPPGVSASGNGATTAASPKHQRPTTLRRRSSSSGSFRSALATEFDNAVRKRDEESASSSFSLQNRQLWADALFLRLCSRPSRAAPSGATQAGPTSAVAPAPTHTSPAVVSPPVLERTTKEMYRKREGSSSLGRFKKPAAMGHRTSKMASVDVTRAVEAITSSLPLQEGSPKRTRLHRRRPSMPNVPSPTAVKHESCGLTTRSMPVQRLPEWACVERAARKSGETSRSSKEAVVTACALSRAGTLSDVEADAEWRHLRGSPKTGQLRLTPISMGQASSVSSGDSTKPPSPLTPSTTSVTAAIELSAQTKPAFPLEPTRSQPSGSPGRRRVEQRASLPERGPRRSRAHTMGASSHPEEVASMSKGLGGRSGLLPTLMPVLSPQPITPGSLSSRTMQGIRDDSLPAVAAMPAYEPETLLVDVLKAGSACKSLPPSPTSPLSHSSSTKIAEDESCQEHSTCSPKSASSAKQSGGAGSEVLRHAPYVEQGQSRPAKSCMFKSPSLPGRHISPAPSPQPQDETLATMHAPESDTYRNAHKHRDTATSPVHPDPPRHTKGSSTRLSGPPPPAPTPVAHCRTSTGKRSTSSREGNSFEGVDGDGDGHNDGDGDGDGGGNGVARKTARRSGDSPRREQQQQQQQQSAVVEAVVATAGGATDEEGCSATLLRSSAAAPAGLYMSRRAAAREGEEAHAPPSSASASSLSRSPAKRQLSR